MHSPQLGGGGGGGGGCEHGCFVEMDDFPLVLVPRDLLGTLTEAEAEAEVEAEAEAEERSVDLDSLSAEWEPNGTKGAAALSPFQKRRPWHGTSRFKRGSTVAATPLAHTPRSTKYCRARSRNLS